jgi:hypothetical protein
MGSTQKNQGQATGKGSQDSGFSGESVAGALRELEVSTIAAADFLSDTKRAMPAGWTRVVWYKRPFVIAWVFIVDVGLCAALGLGHALGLGLLVAPSSRYFGTRR